MPSQAVLDYRQNALEALRSAMASAVPWPGPGPKPDSYTNPEDLQREIDKQIAFWEAQDVPPAPPSIPGPPAAIDLLAPGDRFQKDGIVFEVFETPFGNFAKRIGPVPPVAPAAQTVASVISNLVAYIKERYTLTADAEAQTELRLLLTYLAGLPK
jgi:hypothetical protein